MWYVATFVAAYVAAIYTWAPVRAWLMSFYEHPVDTIKADIEVLKEKLHKKQVGS